MRHYKQILLYFRDYINLTPDGVITKACYDGGKYPFDTESYSEAQAKNFLDEHKSVVLQHISDLLAADNFHNSPGRDRDTQSWDFKSGLETL